MTSAARLLFLLVAPVTLWSQRSGDFLLVARRSGIAEILDAVTLQTVTRIHFDFHVEKYRVSRTVPCSTSMDTRMARAANTTRWISRRGN
jgi:hypothetical protein